MVGAVVGACVATGDRRARERLACAQRVRMAMPMITVLGSVHPHISLLPAGRPGRQAGRPALPGGPKPEKINPAFSLLLQGPHNDPQNLSLISLLL